MIIMISIGLYAAPVNQDYPETLYLLRVNASMLKRIKKPGVNPASKIVKCCNQAA
jgi:hypothetical protein